MEDGRDGGPGGAALPLAGAPFRLYYASHGRAGGLDRVLREGRRLGTALPARFAAALRLEAERGALFLFVPVLLGLGAVLYFTAPFEPGLLLLFGCLGILCVLAALARPWRAAFLALSAGALCLCGASAAKLETLRLSTRMLGSEVVTRINGTVVQVEHRAAGRVRLTIDVTATERPTLRYAPDRVRVTAAKVPEALLAGATVSGLVRLMPPSGPAMPGGYDFSFQSYFDGIGASGFFLGAPIVQQVPETAAGLTAWIENARDRIAARIRGQIGGPEGEIAAALIVGVRGGIPEPVNEALRRTGLAHVLSISGLHMAMVAATVMGGARALLACFPGFASRRPVKKLAALTALLVVSLYVAFSGADVAAVRSYLMLAVMLVAILFDRAALSVRNLAIAATVILLVWPHEILGPSFQMSFAATGALVATYAAWADRRGARGHSRPQRHAALRVLQAGVAAILALAATSLIAGAATTAFGIYHFQRLAPLSLPANLATMPIVSTLVMPFALLGMLAMPFGWDGPFFAVMGLGLRWMIGLAEWFSARSPLDAVGGMPSAALVLVILALLGFTMATTWLRYAPVPLAALAFLLGAATPRPEVFVSEDAKLVGVVTPDGRLAVNVARGGGFTLKNWLHASAASRAIRPNAGKEAPFAFSCAEGVCTLHLSENRTVSYAATAQAAASACGTATLLISAEALPLSCARAANPAIVLTKQQLALRGSAAVILPEGASSIAIRYAVPPMLRPWHDHRRFSRAARGLAERRSKKRQEASPIPGQAQPGSD